MSSRLPPGTRLIGFGFFVAFMLIGGILGGVWLDGVTGLRPLFTLLGLVLGLVIAGVGVMQMVRETMDEADRVR